MSVRPTPAAFELSLGIRDDRHAQRVIQHRLGTPRHGVAAGRHQNDHLSDGSSSSAGVAKPRATPGCDTMPPATFSCHRSQRPWPMRFDWKTTTLPASLIAGWRSSDPEFAAVSVENSVSVVDVVTRNSSRNRS